MKAKTKPVYVVTGEAKDQETIIRQKHLYEDYVSSTLGKSYSRTELFWNMNKSGNFEFRMDFYA